MTIRHRPTAAELHDLYANQHLTQQQMAERLNVSYQTIRAWMAKANIPLRTGGRPPADGSVRVSEPPTEEELHDLYKQGLSATQIGDQFNVTYQTANRWLRNAGISTGRTKRKAPTTHRPIHRLSEKERQIVQRNVQRFHQWLGDRRQRPTNFCTKIYTQEQPYGNE